METPGRLPSPMMGHRGSLPWLHSIPTTNQSQSLNESTNQSRAVYAFAKPKTRGIGVAMEMFPSLPHSLSCTQIILFWTLCWTAKIPYSRAYEIFLEIHFSYLIPRISPNFRRWNPTTNFSPNPNLIFYLISSNTQTLAYVTSHPHYNS